MLKTTGLSFSSCRIEYSGIHFVEAVPLDTGHTMGAII
jgi:hypothetical protein